MAGREFLPPRTRRKIVDFRLRIEEKNYEKQNKPQMKENYPKTTRLL
jgi:hypothetical protein